MATEKTFAYAELTASAEAEIERNANLAASEDLRGRQYYRTHAHGVFTLWLTLTMGWQNDGDRARLEGMVTAINPIESQ